LPIGTGLGLRLTLGRLATDVVGLPEHVPRRPWTARLGLLPRTAAQSDLGVGIDYTAERASFGMPYPTSDGGTQ